MILVIDPGLENTGWAIIENDQFQISNFQLKGCGVIVTSVKQKSAERLVKIYNELEEIIKKYQVTEMAIETLFFAKNAKSALSVSEAIGVVKLVGIKNKLEVAEYTPLQVKMALVGYGRAEKEQVETMVRATLGREGEKLCEDGAEGGRLRKGRGERTNGTDGCKSEGVQGGGALEGGQARGRRREGKAAKGEREPSRQNSFFGLFGWSEKSGPRGKGKWCLMRRFYGLTWEGLPGDSSSLRMTFLGGGAGRGQEGAGATFYTSCERKPEKPSERQKTSNGRKRSLSTFSFPPQSLSHLEVGSIHRPGRESPAARCRPLLLPAAAAAAAEHGAKRVK